MILDFGTVFSPIGRVRDPHTHPVFLPPQAMAEQQDVSATARQTPKHQDGKQSQNYENADEQSIARPFNFTQPHFLLH